MLNLNKLAKEIDEALEKETAESWNEFLQSEDEGEYIKFLGEGELLNFKSCIMESNVGTMALSEVAISVPAGEYNYGLAA
jgi:hypothetical protein